MTSILFVVAGGLAFVLQPAQAFALAGPCLARPAPCLRRSAAAAMSAQTGEHIFSANCAASHAGGLNAIVHERSPEKTAIDKYLTGGFNEKTVAYQIKKDKHVLPVVAERMADAEVALVAAYVIKSAANRWD